MYLLFNFGKGKSHGIHFMCFIQNNFISVPCCIHNLVIVFTMRFLVADLIVLIFCGKCLTLSL